MTFFDGGFLCSCINLKKFSLLGFLILILHLRGVTKVLQFARAREKKRSVTYRDHGGDGGGGGGMK